MRSASRSSREVLRDGARSVEGLARERVSHDLDRQAGNDLRGEGDPVPLYASGASHIVGG